MKNQYKQGQTRTRLLFQFRNLLLAALLLCSTFSLQAQTGCPTYSNNIAYVNGSGTVGTNDGTSWTAAFLTLEEALVAARTCGVTQIWVARGTYQPTAYPVGITSSGTLSNADFSFHLVNGVAIYGGFSGLGFETQLSQRNARLNKTILSGGGTTRHVLLSVNDGLATVVDGFTITGGNAFSGFSTVEGVGITGSRGAGMYLTGSSITLNDLIFNGNQADYAGGMIMVGGASALTNMVFVGNSSTNAGGAMEASNSTFTLTNGVFAENISTGNGGGAMFISGGGQTLRNVVFSQNRASRSNPAANGGAIMNNASTLDLINCTFFGNSAAGTGGVMYNVNGSTIRDKNGIYFGNTAASFPDVRNFTTSGFATDTFTPTTTLFGTDPKFVNGADPDGPDNVWLTADDGLTLQSTSPAINAGTAAGAPATDILGAARVGNTDQGAYERTPCTGFIASLTPVNTTLTFANPSVTLTTTATGATSYTLSDGQTNTTGQFVVSEEGLYTVTASNANGCIAKASALVASELPTVSIVGTADGAEDVVNGLFTITTDRQFTSPVTITISIAGNAIEGTDYATIGSTVVFPANQSSVTIPVSVIGDDLVEGDETVIVTMNGTDNPNVSIGANNDATVTITDDDTAELSIAATTDAAEDDVDGLFTITTDKQFTSPVNVTINVGGTATQGTDYSTIGTLVEFPANQSSFTVPVSVIGDDLIEGDETVIVTMTGTDNVAVTIGFLDQATVTIEDNDLILFIDASASGTPVPVGQDALLSATVTSDQPGNPPVAGVVVTFSLDGVVKGTGVTNAFGVATLTVPAAELSSTPIVYKVLAEAGKGEGRVESVAYLPIYDPNGNFVTGGGWIMSPAGAYKADESLTGKANFGFVSKYKKGSNQVDGTTDFQFIAGDLKFKSTLHESGSLVISGKKATYRGEGTINGQPGYKFTLVALDGDYKGGTAPDQFRIKIWGDSGIIYDNGLGADDNSDASTILGGGSIAIHEAKGRNNKRVVADLVTVPWNTPSEEIEKMITGMSSDWFEGKDIKLTINAESYNSLQSGFYKFNTELVENEWFALEEPIIVNVLVADKPLATDIQLSNTIIQRNISNGSIIGDLSTIDPVDNQHTYSIAENADFELVGKSLIWKGTAIPATARITVFSTDRAGQTIERAIELNREPRFGDFIMFPNPAHSDVNLEVELDQSMNVGIRIYDAVGRLVFQEEGVQSGIATYQIAIEHLSPGLYTVQMKTGKLVMNKRLIKK